MRDTRTGLERKMKAGWQFKLFDYSKVATHWAARPEVAQCLSRYLMAVSDAHRVAGGDGRVFVVAHSMGGLATAFAVSRDFGGQKDLAGRLGGLVTIDTPWTGAPWGHTAYAALLDSLSRSKYAGPWALFGDAASDAWKCLRARPRNADTDCPTAPYLPKSVPVAQLAGEITIQRNFFGIHAYDISMGSDAVVPSASQHGYLGSAQGSTRGFHTTAPTYQCRTTLESIAAIAGATKGPLGALLGTQLQLWSDGKAMDALANDTASADLIEFTALTIKAADCSHLRITTSSQGLDGVADALKEQASGPRLQVTDALNAPVPADCQHKAGRLKDGALPGLRPSDGFAHVRDAGKWVVTPVLTDLTGDGTSELVSALYCSAGGVGWPERLLVYGAGPKLLYSVSLGDITPAEHGTFSSVAASGGDLNLAWVTYEGCCGNKKTWSGRLHWNGTTFAVNNLRQLSGSRAPGRWVLTSSSPASAFMTASGNIVCVLQNRQANSSVDCELRRGDFGTTVPPRPTSCNLEWGRRISLAERAGFACTGDTLGYEARLGTGLTDWFDHSTDLVIDSPAGPAAALRPVSVIENYTVTCTVDQAEVTCANSDSGASFTMTSTSFTMRN